MIDKVLDIFCLCLPIVSAGWIVWGVCIFLGV